MAWKQLGNRFRAPQELLRGWARPRSPKMFGTSSTGSALRRQADSGNALGKVLSNSIRFANILILGKQRLKMRFIATPLDAGSGTKKSNSKLDMSSLTFPLFARSQSSLLDVNPAWRFSNSSKATSTRRFCWLWMMVQKLLQKFRILMLVGLIMQQQVRLLQWTL